MLLYLRLDNNIDRVVFESVVEKINIGGYNDEGVEEFYWRDKKSNDCL